MQVSKPSNAGESRAPQKAFGFMAELDEWTDKVIIEPLKRACHDVENAPVEEIREEAEGILLTEVAAVKKAVRERVLESYRNGQAAGPTQSGRTAPQERRAFSRGRPFRRA